MNVQKIQREFDASQVGQLARRHEATAESRAEQQAIPYTGLSYADERNKQRTTQQSNEDLK